MSRQRLRGRCCLMLAVFGLICTTPFRPVERLEAGEPKWQLRFSADFATDSDKRLAVGNEWLVRSGKWAMENGMLHGRGPGAVVMYKGAFRPPFRIVYDCTSQSPCDLSLVLRSNLDDRNYTGYFIGFGSQNNTCTKITSEPGGQLATATSPVIQPGKTHQVMVELRERTLRLAIDGREVRCVARRPGVGVRHFGLYVWNRGSFDNVNVYSPNRATGPPTVEATSVRQFRSFNAEPVGGAPADCKVTAGQGCHARLVDVPTWIYDTDDKDTLPSYGLFYMAVDTSSGFGRSAMSIDWGRTFTTLLPGGKKSSQGEYMVRLEVAMAAENDVVHWKTVQDDDGKHERHQGVVRPHVVLRKVLKLDAYPARIKAARLKYLISGNPHHAVTRKHHSRPEPGVRWAQVLIRVNDQLVARDSPMELATKGWHTIPIKPGALKRGDNTVTFTWAKMPLGEHFVPDPCLELVDVNDGKGQVAAAEFDMPDLSAGLVQFDIMAEHYDGEALRVQLGAGVGLVIGADGSFQYEAGGKRMALLETISYPNVPNGRTRCRLHAQRWCTLRIDFDCPNATANVALVRRYETTPDNAKRGAHYLVLGQDLPMPLKGVQSLRFQTVGKGRFLVDNIFTVARTEDLAGEAAWRVPAARITGSRYPRRKDPFDVQTYSLRHIHTRGRAFPGPEYGRLLSGEFPGVLRCAR